ncbi:MAG TPA: response regulator [Polyangiaceae bacterium]|nr:response regulator [Polyangiaceae bacterium]
MPQTTVLLAEDQATVRLMITRVLEKRECRVIVASDGVEAVELYREHMSEIDVIVLDIRMPRLEGPQALAQMRALGPPVPAILMSGFADSNDELAALLASGVRFVPKPLRAVELAALVCSLAANPPT